MNGGSNLFMVESTMVGTHRFCFLIYIGPNVAYAIYKTVCS